MSSVRKQRVRLTPQNQPSGNKFSATNYPSINFLIGQQQAMLDPRTLRINGQLRILDADGKSVINDNTLTGAPTAQNGASLNNSIGVSSVIDEANIQTLNGRNLETVRNYNRFLAVGKPLVNNSLDYSNGLGLRDPMLTDKSITNSKTANVKHDFSVKLDVGMFDSEQLIPLSQKGFHGLQIDLLLAQNASAVQPYFRYTGSLQSDKVPVIADSTYNYEIQNLSLTFDLIRLDDATFRSMPSSGAMNYNSISTLHSTLLSQDQTINLRFGQNSVQSVTHSITPALHINNISVDSFQLSKPQRNTQANADGIICEIRNVQYMRAGQLFPYNFMLDSELQLGDVNVVGASTNPAPQAQIMKPFQNSVSLFDPNNRTKLNPNGNIGLNTSNAPAGGSMPLASGSDPKSIFGLGCPMDSLRQGVSFRDREYAIRIQSELNDTDANSFFTFTRGRNIAQYSPTGISVVE